MTNVLLAGELEQKQFNGLLKVLAILALKLRGQAIKTDLKPIADAQLKDVKAILKKLGADQTLFDDLYDNILKKSTTVDPYAEAFIKNLRKRIRETNLANNLDNLTIKQKEIMNYIFTLVSSPESESAYSSLQRRISNLGDPVITKRFIEFHTETGDSPSVIRGEIETLVKKLTGRKGLDLTADEKKKFADNEDKKTIAKLRSKYSEAIRQSIKQIVLDSGKQYIPVSQVMKTLKNDGTGVTPYPTIFSQSKHIYVNIDGQLCNAVGDVLNQKSLSPTFKFELNDKYDPAITTKGKTWLYKVTNPETNLPNYIGTVTRSAQAKEAKFEKLTDLLTSGEIHNIKKKWRRSLSSKPADFKKMEVVSAYLTEFLYNTSSRVGSEEKGGMTGGIQTFGASNAPIKSIKRPTGGVVPSKLKIEYFVKGGHKETFVIDPAKSSDSQDKEAKEKLIRFLIAKCENKSPDDPIFTLENDKKRLPLKDYTTWLKAQTTLTAHNFRTLRGTEVFIALEPGLVKKVQSAINKAKPKKLPDKTVHDLFKETMMEVGKILGHIRRTKEGVEENTANTSIAYYCNPNNMLDFYKKVGFAPMPAVVAAARRANADI